MILGYSTRDHREDCHTCLGGQRRSGPTGSLEAIHGPKDCLKFCPLLVELTLAKFVEQLRADVRGLTDTAFKYCELTRESDWICGYVSRPFVRPERACTGHRRRRTGLDIERRGARAGR